VVRIISEHRPKAFLLENVKNLVNHDKGRTFVVIMRTLRELGYHVPTPRVINAKGHVPQHRERILIAGFREECDFSFDDLDVPSPLNGPWKSWRRGLNDCRLVQRLPDGGAVCCRCAPVSLETSCRQE